MRFYFFQPAFIKPVKTVCLDPIFGQMCRFHRYLPLVCCRLSPQTVKDIAPFSHGKYGQSSISYEIVSTKTKLTGVRRLPGARNRLVRVHAPVDAWYSEGPAVAHDKSLDIHYHVCCHPRRSSSDGVQGKGPARNVAAR